MDSMILFSTAKHPRVFSFSFFSFFSFFLLKGERGGHPYFHWNSILDKDNILLFRMENRVWTKKNKRRRIDNT